jgi:hypothetical protein
MMKLATITLGAAILVTQLFGGASVFGAGPMTGGMVHVFVTPSNGGANDILITGAIGDSGKSVNIDKGGKPNPNGNFGRVTLKHGTFEVDLTKLQAAQNNGQPTVNPMNCSGIFSVTEPVTFFGGTGAYKGIAGTVQITSEFGFILPKYTSGTKKGQCNESDNAEPVAQSASITGSGMVTFG